MERVRFLRYLGIAFQTRAETVHTNMVYGNPTSLTAVSGNLTRQCGYTLRPALFRHSYNRITALIDVGSKPAARLLSATYYV